MAVAMIILGLLLMTFGGVMLCGWLSGKSRWFGEAVFDRAGDSKTDRQFLDLYFLAIVIAPLLVGAILIVYGIRRTL